MALRRFSPVFTIPCVLACGGADGAPTEASNDMGSETDTGAAPAVGEPTSEEGLTAPGANPGPGEPSQAPSPSDTAEPMSPAAPEIPNTTPGASGLPFEPAAPETLIHALDFPARVAVDGERFYVANRRSMKRTGELDEILVMPIGGAVGSHSVLFQQPDITGVAVSDEWVWTASISTEEYIMYDKASGEETLRASAPGRQPYAVATNQDYAFLASAFSIDRVPLAGGTNEPLWEPEGRAPQWVYATDQHLFVVADRPISDVQNVSELVSIDLSSGAPTVLVPEGSSRLGGLATHEGDVLYNDVSAGTLNRIPVAGGSASVVAAIAEPWALAVDGDFAYVTTQPETRYCDGPEGTLQRVSLRDGSIVVLSTDVWCPSMLLVAGNGLYWVNNGDVTVNVDGQVVSQSTGSFARLTR